MKRKPSAEREARLAEVREWVRSEVSAGGRQEIIDYVKEVLEIAEEQELRPWAQAGTRSQRLQGGVSSTMRFIAGDSITEWVLELHLAYRAFREREFAAMIAPKADDGETLLQQLVVLQDIRELVRCSRDLMEELAKGQRVMLSGQLPIVA